MNNALSSCLCFKLLNVNLASLLVVESLISDDRDLSFAQLLESTPAMDKLIENVDYVFARAVHADSKAGARHAVDKVAKAFEEFLKVGARVCIHLAIHRSIIYSEVSLAV